MQKSGIKKAANLVTYIPICFEKLTHLCDRFTPEDKEKIGKTEKGGWNGVVDLTDFRFHCNHSMLQ